MRKLERAVARSNMALFGIPHINRVFAAHWRNFVSIESGKRYLRKLAKEEAARERAYRAKLVKEEAEKQAALKEAGTRYLRLRPSLFARIARWVKALFHKAPTRTSAKPVTTHHDIPGATNIQVLSREEHAALHGLK